MKKILVKNIVLLFIISIFYVENKMELVGIVFNSLLILFVFIMVLFLIKIRKFNLFLKFYIKISTVFLISISVFISVLYPKYNNMNFIVMLLILNDVFFLLGFIVGEYISNKVNIQKLYCIINDIKNDLNCTNLPKEFRYRSFVKINEYNSSSINPASGLLMISSCMDAGGYGYGHHHR